MRKPRRRKNIKTGEALGPGAVQKRGVDVHPTILMGESRVAGVDPYNIWDPWAPLVGVEHPGDPREMGEMLENPKDEDIIKSPVVK